MSAAIIDGRAAAAELRAGLFSRATRQREAGVVPRLVVVLAGDDEASLAYVRSLVGTGKQTAIDVDVATLGTDASEEALRAELERLGHDRTVHGVMLQQPLPSGVALRNVAESIAANKDVDCSSPVNQGRLAFGGAAFVPATPAAVMVLLERSPAWPLRGKACIVIGRSSVVGVPVALLAMRADATVTIAHSKTLDLPATVRRADVVVAAAGVPRMVTGEMLRAGCTVIDVGTTVVDGKLVGDVDFESARTVAAAITPVPGGVGPVTNAALMQNVLTACERLTDGLR
ncbi:MAG TPA: bifunctional 5,10-methylenetetrahydrofolate dehydrogenase/5,10-methenyltetrahydrofolate cyclohydrolase [Candidatus Acidoferrales bacterium]|nr:bifunctional 5,10-methylenetetrahydrofolate dehydrogenase/5,10-methenyltetrahydrofolate cyclohydrolase [Candidatus Acidoferrales bacterium]